MYWLIGGATAMGICMWSMHFTAMLAFSLPVPTLYDWPTLLLSLLLGILSSGLALIVVSRDNLRPFWAVGAAVLMGGASRSCITRPWRPPVLLLLPRLRTWPTR